jgi:hypothetical protein
VTHVRRHPARGQASVGVIASPVSKEVERTQFSPQGVGDTSVPIIAGLRVLLRNLMLFAIIATLAGTDLLLKTEV